MILTTRMTKAYLSIFETVFFGTVLDALRDSILTMLGIYGHGMGMIWRVIRGMFVMRGPFEMGT